MATRGIVPVNTGEGSIGTSSKKWGKGWFDALHVAGNLDDGTNTVTIAQMKDLVDGHADTHEAGGSDEIDVRGLQGGWLTADIEANRPAAGTKDRYFYATDTGKLYYDNGTSWVEITPTPAEHGNEAHNPDMLPLSTSSAIDAYMSGNKWLSVTTSGIVGLPKQSRCRAYLSGSNQSVPSATWTKIQLNATLYDEQGEFDTTTNYRFTATEAGYYIVIGSISILNIDDQKTVTVAIRKNGASCAYTRYYTSGTAAPIISAVSIAHLDAGDYLELWVYHNHGSNRDVAAGSSYTYMAIHKLS